jgi:phosphoribosylformylglycinamidine synthase
VPAFDPAGFISSVNFVVGEIAAICAGGASDVTAVHDVGGGGVAVALAELVAATGLGLDVDEFNGHAELFSEYPGRFVMATNDLEAFRARGAAAGVALEVLGTVGTDRLRIADLVDLSVSDIQSRRQYALEEALASLD